MNFPHGILLVSFDISSLFTNVPVRETVNIALNSVFNENEMVNGIDKKLFKKLLELCVQDNRFIFNEEHMQQHEGFAMGSPLSAPMANLFLAHHEVRWLDQCPPDFKPLLYKRYVDDTFMVFRSLDQVDRFFHYINQRHPNIKFTRENENDNSLNFLDLQIEKHTQNNEVFLRTKVYRKPTFTGLGLNFHSSTYFNFKINSIKTLIFRAYQLCDSWMSFHHEMCFLSNFFETNGYPGHIFTNVLKSFLKKKFSSSNTTTTVNRLPFYVKLPFISNSSCKFMKSHFTKILRPIFTHIDFKFVFLNNNTIHGLLSHKEKLPDALCSGLVYKYECGACGATYIGQTQKALQTRAGEHFGVSPRTGTLLARPTQSVIRDHLEGCSGSRSLEDFRKVRSFSDSLLLKIYESLEIDFRKPSLNHDGSSVQLFLG